MRCGQPGRGALGCVNMGLFGSAMVFMLPAPDSSDLARALQLLQRHVPPWHEACPFDRLEDLTVPTPVVVTGGTDEQQCATRAPASLANRIPRCALHSPRAASARPSFRVCSSTVHLMSRYATTL